MNNISQFVFDTKKALDAYGDYNSDNYVNADKFDATGKFNDIWNECHSALVIKYSLPSFHLWEDGFVQGDASDDEITESIAKINSIEGTETVSTEDVFEFLDGKLLQSINPKAKLLIQEYNSFCENKKSTRDRNCYREA